MAENKIIEKIFFQCFLCKLYQALFVFAMESFFQSLAVTAVSRPLLSHPHGKIGMDQVCKNPS
jgi:hypothetical protein